MNPQQLHDAISCLAKHKPELWVMGIEAYRRLVAVMPPRSSVLEPPMPSVESVVEHLRTHPALMIEIGCGDRLVIDTRVDGTGCYRMPWPETPWRVA